jgi:hypothetical protein
MASFGRKNAIAGVPPVVVAVPRVDVPRAVVVVPVHVHDAGAFSYQEPSLAPPVEYSSGCIVCGTYKSTSSGYQLTNVFVGSWQCALLKAVARRILAFPFPKSPCGSRGHRITGHFGCSISKGKSPGPSDKVSKGPRIPSAVGGQSCQASVGGRKNAKAGVPPVAVAAPRVDVPRAVAVVPEQAHDAGARVEQV